MNVRDVLPRDAIPSIDDPSFGPDYIGDPDDEVVVLEGDSSRAYPIRLLSYHEIVNDTVEGNPLAITWCPICASAVVYERTVGDRVLSFGVSGKLADDALVMYDRETESEWKQSSGTAIAGPLEGTELTVVPAGMTTWAEFSTQFSEGNVLQPDASREASAYEMAPYERYFDADGFGVGVMRGTGPSREWNRTDIGPKESVLGIEYGGDAVGYPISRVESARGRDVIVFADGGRLHAFENPGYEFTASGPGLVADGARWNAATGRSDDGRQLRRISSRRLYAFAWQDDHGPSAFYGL